jgi:hypothetical protein
MHEVLLGDGHISPKDYIVTLARILDVPFIHDPISAGYRYRKRGVPCSTEAVWRTGWGTSSVALDGSAFPASELVRRQNVMRRKGLELALTTPIGLRSVSFKAWVEDLWPWPSMRSDDDRLLPVPGSELGYGSSWPR